MSAPEICPHCGANVPPSARCCPHCGSDEDTGWSDKATADRLGIPDDEFDYEEFVKEEFGPSHPVRPRGISWFWWLVGLLVLLALLFYFL